MTTLSELPSTFADSRLGMHLVGAYLMSPARRVDSGRIGLIASPGGFATPMYGNGTVLRIRGAEIVRETASQSMSSPMASLEQVGEFLGMAPDVEWASKYDIPEAGPLDADLKIDHEGAKSVAQWFAFGWDRLMELAGDPQSAEASQPQLWPEHFDPAIEVGSAASEQRASYGASPGDATHDEPYLYVGPWFADSRPASDYWNDSSFPGASLTYAELLSSKDPVDRAASFYREGRKLLTGS